MRNGVVAVCLLLLGVRAGAWTQGLVLGHEELTVLAIEQVNSPLFPPAKAGELAINSTNPIILGNFAMDFPSGSGGGADRFAKLFRAAAAGLSKDDAAKLLAENDHYFAWADLVSVADEVLKMRLTKSWQEDDAFQPLHFLRTPGLTITTSCEIAKEAVGKLIEFPILPALEIHSPPDPSGKNSAYRDAKLKMAYLIHAYYTGVMLHIIQDSFSEAHTERTGTYLETLKNLCLYKADKPPAGACVHANLDARDSIWQDPNDARTYPGKSWAKLRPAAQAAVQASAAFLKVLKELDDYEGKYITEVFKRANADEVDKIFPELAKNRAKVLARYFNTGAPAQGEGMFVCPMPSN